MTYIKRTLTERIKAILGRGKSVLLLGPRQTGKTTLLNHLKCDAAISLVDIRVRLRYEMHPTALANEIEAIADQLSHRPLIFIDEIQKIPLLMDAIQDLIDRKIAQFVLTGSSARKLRKGGDANLLPGRLIPLHLDPLTLQEIPKERQDLMTLLLYGALPEILLIKNFEEKEELLNSYISIYLEEEIRAEAVVRSLGSFARFLELAAAESSNPINLSKLSQEVGVAHNTIAGYYDILEDCLVAERIEPIVESKTRRKLMKAQKYLIFDLGVRRLAAKEGIKLPLNTMGHIFEQFVGLELLREIRNQSKSFALRYWRDPDGPEVDWVLQKEEHYIPIEVKWTDTPTEKDARHLKVFLSEYPMATKGYILCQTPRMMKISEDILALPWQELPQLVNQLDQ